jgi:hypothetical protein
MLPNDWSPANNLPRHAVDEQWIQHVLVAEEAERLRRAMRPPVRARVAARVFAGRLDRALVAGADPAASPRLAARAWMLTSRSTRSELADGLDRLIATAQLPPPRRRALPRHSSVLANSKLLRELAETLRGSSPLYASGIAMLCLLLSDGTGPVYTASDGRALEGELHRARAALTCS